jgi:putative oxidoreductase
MSAVANKIPHYNDVVKVMEAQGMPQAPILLAGAIVFLLVGSVTVVVGYQARLGAFLLLVFLILATYDFHDFWTMADPQAKQAEMANFMKNLALMGAMLLVLANGPGGWSLDARREKKAAPQPGGG